MRRAWSAMERWGRAGAGVSLVSVVALAATGCNGFFVYPGSTSSSSSSATVDYAYVSNSAAGSNEINGYSLSGGSLVATTGSPYNVGFVPSAMVVTTNNSFLYVASDPTLSTTGEIYGYAIGTGGALTILNSSLGLEAENSAALAVSPDGQWLFSLNTSGSTMEEYKINATTGLLTAVGNYPITVVAGGIATPNAVAVSPNGNYIVCALGTGGADLYAFTTSTGVASSAPAVLAPASSASGFYAVAIDANNNAYLAGTSGLVTYTVAASSGSATATLASGASGYGLGSGNVSAVVTKSSNYVFAGSQNGGVSSGLYSYAVAGSGLLTTVSGSPFSAPTDVSALGVDSTGNYLIATGYSSTSGTQLFSIGSGGALTSLGTVANGGTTTIPAVVALTH